MVNPDSVTYPPLPPPAAPGPGQYPSEPNRPTEYYHQAYYQPQPNPPTSAPPVSPGYLPGPYSPAPQQPMIVVQPARPTSGMAVASMVLGIIGLVFGCYTFAIPNLLAILFGHLGYTATRDGTVAGSGMAVAGLVMGYLMVVPVIAVLVLGGVGALIETVNPTPTTSP